jgi:hypothetical protein
LSSSQQAWRVLLFPSILRAITPPQDARHVWIKNLILSEGNWTNLVPNIVQPDFLWAKTELSTFLRSTGKSKGGGIKGMAEIAIGTSMSSTVGHFEIFVQCGTEIFNLSVEADP